MFYIGQTGRRLGDRIAEHIRDISNNNGRTVPNHFNSEGHSLSDLDVLGLKYCTSTETRLNMEKRLIVQLGTLRPNGINSSLDV